MNVVDYVKYVGRRTGHAVVVVWVTFTAAFLLLFILPGDAALNKIGGGGGGSGAFTEANVNKLRAAMGLNKPMLVQYYETLWHALHGNFGLSYETGGSATSLFFQAVPATLELAASALIFGTVLGISWALVGSTVRRPVVREFFSSVPMLGISVPSFWVGLVLIQIFSFRLGWLPSTGNLGFRSLILPAIMLGLPTASMVTQLVSRSLSEVKASPYIETAIAKGLKRRTVLLRHVLRNAIIPVVTTLGVYTGYLLAGSVVAETVFSRAGIGTITVDAVNDKDTPVVLLAVVFVSVVFASINLIVDFLYPVIDRRISVSGSARTALR